MTNVEMVRGFIARALEDTEIVAGRAEADEDGDYLIRRGSALYWVSAVQTSSGEGLVQIVSCVLSGVPLSKKVLRAVNDINNSYLQIRAVWADDSIRIHRELSADTVTAAEIAQACAFIGTVADEQDDRLKALLDVGEIAFDDDADDDDAVEV